MARIKSLREQIDEIDREIIALLERRLEIARQIGEIKKSLGLPIEDKSREEEVLRRAGKFRPIFEKILEVSKDVQRL
ncbi:chorismate mutase [Pyrococcus kukulkanii]|uniref:Chorismate mutase n=2 Tax=Thermococcales TaxID=2258 RepID=A0A170SV50_9EURY|nr:chorismate mutase [Thermococcus chitonophagus]CUX78736.1 Chorismate mutase I [Thermococcus chitonophagus]